MSKKKRYEKMNNRSEPNAHPSPQEREGLLKMNIDPIIRNLRVKTNRDLISQIRATRGNNQFISIVLRDGVQLMPEMILPLFEVLQKIGKTESLDVFLYTTGGATEVPWRIVSLIREYCKEFTAIIPFISLSAGTHIALGANQLMMSEISTLGPVDPTTRHALLPTDKNGKPIPVSVEDLKNCIKFIAQQLKDQGEELKYTPTDMTHIVSKLFEHIEPLAIGAVERAYGLSRLVTRKVLETHLNPIADADKIDTIVDKIGGEYFSHSFPITRRDVEQELKLKVEKPSTDLFNKIWSLYEYYRKAFAVQNDIQMNLEHKDQQGKVIGKTAIPLILRILGFMDSESERRALVQVETIRKDGQEVKREIVFAHWIKPMGAELSSSDVNSFIAVPSGSAPLANAAISTLPKQS